MPPEGSRTAGKHGKDAGGAEAGSLVPQTCCVVQIGEVDPCGMAILENGGQASEVHDVP